MKSLTCKLWKVSVVKHDSWTYDVKRGYTAHDKGTILASCAVYAVNKTFAKWNSEACIGYTAGYSLLYPEAYIRKRVSLIRGGE